MIKDLVREYKDNRNSYGKRYAYTLFLSSEWRGRTMRDRIEGMTYSYFFKDYYREDLVSNVISSLMRRDVLGRIDLDRTEEEIVKYFYNSCENAILDTLSVESYFEDSEYLYQELDEEGREESRDKFYGDYLSDESYNPEQIYLQKIDDNELLVLLVNELTKKQLDVALLLMDGYNQSEIAEKLGVTHQAISDMTNRIREVLSKTNLIGNNL